ncbi:MAG: amidohydrolase [Tissierellia bacterium]|nr:amidohydrolase [Tissierellia bacterium]
MLVIKNGLIYTMAGEIIENGTIIIENGKIAAVGKDLEFPNDARIIDVEGQMVTPGFVDAHCHIGLHEDAIRFEGQDYNERTDPITPELRAIDAINPMDLLFQEAREGGVTTAVTGPGSANVIGGQFAAVKTVGNRVDNMIIKFPTAMKIAFGENPKFVYNEQKKSPVTRMAVAGLLRETLFKAKEYNDKLNNGEKVDFNMKYDALRPVMNKEIPLKSHAHRADDIFTSLRIAKEFDLDITLDHCTEGHLIADELAKEGKPALVGPTFGSRTKFELKNKSFDTPRVLNEAGLKIAIITDAPVLPLQSLPMCVGLAVNAGLDEMEGFKAVTINAAEISGIADRVGSLEVGKDADIVVWDKNPIRTIDYKVMYTIIDGEVVYEG